MNSRIVQGEDSPSLMNSRIVQGEDEENDVLFAHGEDEEYETEEIYDYYEEIDGAEDIVFYDPQQDHEHEHHTVSLLIPDPDSSSSTLSSHLTESQQQNQQRSGIATKLHKQINVQYKSLLISNPDIPRPNVIEIGSTQRNLKATAVVSTKNVRQVKETILQLNTELMILCAEMKSTQIHNSWLESLVLEPKPLASEPITTQK